VSPKVWRKDDEKERKEGRRGEKEDWDGDLNECTSECIDETRREIRGGLSFLESKNVEAHRRRG